MMQVKRKVHVQFNKLYHALRALYKHSYNESVFHWLLFSSLEPTILLACGRDRELWPDPIF